MMSGIIRDSYLSFESSAFFFSKGIIFVIDVREKVKHDYLNVCGWDA